MRHDRWLDLAIKLAEKNPNNKHKHGAVFVSSGRVLAVGLNTERKGFYPSRHAEWDAVREHLNSRGTLYVARVYCKTSEIAYSKPCDKCLNTLLDYTKVQKVFYTSCGNDLYGDMYGEINLTQERQIRRD